MFFYQPTSGLTQSSLLMTGVQFCSKAIGTDAKTTVIDPAKAQLKAIAA